MRTARISLLVAVPLLALAAVAAAQDALHEVQPGDDLHLIAGYYYGDARQWERIWQANREQIPSPNRIERGILLRIPDAVAPEEPYPAFVARARRASAPAGLPATPEAAPGGGAQAAGGTPPASPGPQAAPVAPPGPGGRPPGRP